MKTYVMLSLLPVAFLLQAETVVTRMPAHPIEDIFLQRRSAYALSGETISEQELMRIFEAGRWAPSSYNSQPWRFVYARKGTSHWDRLFNLLVDFNKEWVQFADVLVVVVSKDTFDHDGTYTRTHSFDAGAAWQNIGLQAAALGIIAHGMGGFDYDRAKTDLHIPDGYTVEAMFALGRPGSVEQFAAEFQRRDKQVSKRKPLEQIVCEGLFRE